MTSRERLIVALDRGVPDRLPVTTHHLMPSFLAGHGLDERGFFDRFGLDAIRWITPLRADASRDEILAVDPRGALPPFLESETWRVEREELADPEYRTWRYRFVTPRGTLTMVLRDDGRTVWVAERPVKEKRDTALLAEFAPAALCDVEAVNREAAAFGDRGIARGAVPGFLPYGQPGCWQDAAVLCGIEPLILATFSDPGWVLDLLASLRDRKRRFLDSARGARFDLLELGGGDASSSVISPSIFDRFVAPFDQPLVEAAHDAGLRVVYHTCGGMMPFLERIAGMGPDAMETFTPRAMGGDADLAAAKRRIGHQACLIGGFDQFHHFVGCAPGETRRAVRAAFEAAGPGGGFILAPSDHFFEADDRLLDAFADEARQCRYADDAPR